MSYKRPRKILFLDDFPRNNLGKVIKEDLKVFFRLMITSINFFSVSSSSFPELKIDSVISGLSDLHLSVILFSKLRMFSLAITPESWWFEFKAGKRPNVICFHWSTPRGSNVIMSSHKYARFQLVYKGGLSGTIRTNQAGDSRADLKTDVVKRHQWSEPLRDIPHLN